LSNSRELSKIFTADTTVTTHSELITAVNAASVNIIQQAIQYTDNATPDLTPAIQAASAAAVAYTDQELSNIDLTSTIITASAAAASYTDSEISAIDYSTIIQTASAGAVTFLTDSAPGTLDTLNELSAALNDDPNFYSTIQSVYLTQSNASATYLTQSNASSTYLTQAAGLTTATASTTYLTQSSASTTYLTQSSASTQYEKLIPYSTSTPESPVTGDMWLDSNSTPPALKVYDGSSWVQLGAAVDDSQAIISGRMFS
jgi:hypothetical protein